MLGVALLLLWVVDRSPSAAGDSLAQAPSHPIARNGSKIAYTFRIEGSVAGTGEQGLPVRALRPQADRRADRSGLFAALGVSEGAEVQLELVRQAPPREMRGSEGLLGWLHLPQLRMAVRNPSLHSGLLSDRVPVSSLTFEWKSIWESVCGSMALKEPNLQLPDVLIAQNPAELEIARCLSDRAVPMVPETVLVVPAEPDESWDLSYLAERSDRFLLQTDIPSAPAFVSFAQWPLGREGAKPDPRKLLDQLIPALDRTGGFSSRDCMRDKRQKCYKAALQQQLELEVDARVPLVLAVMEHSSEAADAALLPQAVFDAFTRSEADYGMRSQAVFLLCGLTKEDRFFDEQLAQLARTFPERLRVVEPPPASPAHADEAACGRTFWHMARGADVAVDLSGRPRPGRLFAAVYGGALPLMPHSQWLMGEAAVELTAQIPNLVQVFADRSDVTNLHPRAVALSRTLADALLLFGSHTRSADAFALKQEILLLWLGATFDLGGTDGVEAMRAWAESFEAVGARGSADLQTGM
jgi:hypothetical protein